MGVEEVALLEIIIRNWETIGLIFSNIVALFIHPPGRKPKKRKSS